MSKSETTDFLLNWSMLSDPDIIRRCHEQLEKDGAMVIRNFATSKGISTFQDEISSCPFNESTQCYTCWQDQGDSTYPESHPRNFKIHGSASFVGRKSLEQCDNGWGISVYNDRRIIKFLSQVAAKTLYRSSDENGSVYSYRIHQRHNPPWHFDESPYTAIIYLQNSEGGGDFEFVPWCRPKLSKNDVEGHNIVREVVMEGKTDKVKTIKTEPGTLIFFSGAHCFHRAGPITGRKTRIGLVFTFGLDSNFANSDSIHAANEWNPADSTKVIYDEREESG
mmetsp:Transcript_3944/g.5692  ORF Transcript_3944/g.5692 Transcript_3944/m.5692 type:complete len:279 (+) Transcript_3944:110-946(+)